MYLLQIMISKMNYRQLYIYRKKNILKISLKLDEFLNN